MSKEKSRQERAVEAARRKYQSEGEIEIDDNAELSEGEDPGCYVQAWVWVHDIEIQGEP